MNKEKDGTLMESKQTNFNEMLAFGQEGEHIVAQALMSNGIYVMPLYQFSDSLAPAIFNTDEKLTCPDLICFEDGKCFFVEVKRKQTWVRYTGVETGLNLQLYEHYKTLADKTGLPCYVVFLHEKQEPCGTYFTEIHNEHSRSWNGYGGNGYVTRPEIFFTSESLRRIEI